jgi:hypothetical protein
VNSNKSAGHWHALELDIPSTLFPTFLAYLMHLNPLNKNKSSAAALKKPLTLSRKKVRLLCKTFPISYGMLPDNVKVDIQENFEQEEILKDLALAKLQSQHPINELNIVELIEVADLYALDKLCALLGMKLKNNKDLFIIYMRANANSINFDSYFYKHILSSLVDQVFIESTKLKKSFSNKNRNLCRTLTLKTDLTSNEEIEKTALSYSGRTLFVLTDRGSFYYFDLLQNSCIVGRAQNAILKNKQVQRSKNYTFALADLSNLLFLLTKNNTLDIYQLKEGNKVSIKKIIEITTASLTSPYLSTSLDGRCFIINDAIKDKYLSHLYMLDLASCSAECIDNSNNSPRYISADGKQLIEFRVDDPTWRASITSLKDSDTFINLSLKLYNRLEEVFYLNSNLILQTKYSRILTSSSQSSAPKDKGYVKLLYDKKGQAKNIYMCAGPNGIYYRLNESTRHNKITFRSSIPSHKNITANGAGTIIAFLPNAFLTNYTELKIIEPFVQDPQNYSEAEKFSAVVWSLCNTLPSITNSTSPLLELLKEEQEKEQQAQLTSSGSTSAAHIPAIPLPLIVGTAHAVNRAVAVDSLAYKHLPFLYNNSQRKNSPTTSISTIKSVSTKSSSVAAPHFLRLKNHITLKNVASIALIGGTTVAAGYLAYKHLYNPSPTMQ